jgi:hypothetical protein
MMRSLKRLIVLRVRNCCKTTSPIFYQTDIERVAKSLRLKPGEFIDQYLRIDEDKDYVLKVIALSISGCQ